MNKKYIIGVFIFVLSALLVLGAAWFYSGYKQRGNMYGKYIFASTKDKSDYLGRIRIVSPEGDEINVYRLEDGSWRFKEAKDYFVNESALASFFNIVKKSIIVSVRSIDEDFMEKSNLTDSKGVSVQTYDYDGNLLDDIVWGILDEERSVFWTRRKDDNKYAFAVSAINGFPQKPQDWIPYPLLSIQTSEIKSITINGEKTDYREFNKKIRRFGAWRDLVGALNYLEYYGLTFKSDLADLPSDTKIRKIDVGMLNGMIYKLTLLDTADAYWVVISMDANKIYMIEAAQVAMDKYRYYADWVFRLSDEQGRILFSESLFY